MTHLRRTLSPQTAAETHRSTSIENGSKSWSDLPTEVVQLIASFFFKTTDAQSFRAVCKQWRRATQITAFLPRNFTSPSALPKKLVSSSMLLVRPFESSESHPWMVLAVECTKGVTQLFHPFSRTPLQNLPPNLDLATLFTSKLATECHVIDEDCNGFEGSGFYVKSLMFFKRSVPSTGNFRLVSIFHDGLALELEPFGWNSVYEKAFGKHHHVHDIVRYKGKIYALDKNYNLNLYGKLGGNCWYKELDCQSDSRIVRRKRLVVSSSGETLYMIDPVITGTVELWFRVFKVKYISKKSWRWAEVKTFEDADRVLFITKDYCFFVSSGEFPTCNLRNCIVFSDDAFPSYRGTASVWNYGSKGGNEVAVFSLQGRLKYSIPIESYPGFPVKLWSPPALHDARGVQQRCAPDRNSTSQLRRGLSWVLNALKHVTGYKTKLEDDE